ncbi:MULTISPECIES: hypothetical protein [Pseudomonadaceae]|nr:MULTISPECIES: hypothetical protein [Pseudomonas]MCP1616975.1 hypothetical protein [Pseudomonas otitidis]
MNRDRLSPGVNASCQLLPRYRRCRTVPHFSPRAAAQANAVIS